MHGCRHVDEHKCGRLDAWVASKHAWICGCADAWKERRRCGKMHAQLHVPCPHPRCSTAHCSQGRDVLATQRLALEEPKSPGVNFLSAATSAFGGALRRHTPHRIPQSPLIVASRCQMGSIRRKNEANPRCPRPSRDTSHAAASLHGIPTTKVGSESDMFNMCAVEQKVIMESSNAYS